MKHPINVTKLAKDAHKLQLKQVADQGRLMLELCNGSRPNTTYAPLGGGWVATVTAFVDGGKTLTATGKGTSKGDAEDVAYGDIVMSLAETIGKERHASLMKIINDSPGLSVASLRLPPLPDDAMDALINAMGTPEDHDLRMLNWKQAEGDAMAKVMGADGGFDSKSRDKNSSDGGYRRRKENANGAYGLLGATDTADDVLSEDELLARVAERKRALTETFAAEEGALHALAEVVDSHEWQMRETRRNLPITKIQQSLVQALKTNQVVVVSGGTGSGKSTQCPQYILEDAIAKGMVRGFPTQLVPPP